LGGMAVGGWPAEGSASGRPEQFVCRLDATLQFAGGAGLAAVEELALGGRQRGHRVREDGLHGALVEGTAGDDRGGEIAGHDQTDDAQPDIADVSGPGLGRAAHRRKIAGDL